MRFLPPKGTSHASRRRWSNIHLEKKAQQHKTNNNNMNIKIKREIYTQKYRKIKQQ